MKCLVTECENSKIKSRGVCGTCYTTISILTRKGEYTWDELEKMGAINSKNKTKSKVVSYIESLKRKGRLDVGSKRL